MNNCSEDFEQYFFRLKVDDSINSNYLIFTNPFQINHQFFFKIKKKLKSNQLNKVNNWIKEKKKIGEILFDGNKIIFDKENKLKILIKQTIGSQYREYKTKMKYNDEQILQVKLLYETFNFDLINFQVLKHTKQNFTPQKSSQNFIFDPYLNERLALYHGFLNKNNFRSFLKEGKIFENRIFKIDPFNKPEFQEILNENNKLDTKKRLNNNRKSVEKNIIDEKILYRSKKHYEDILKPSKQKAFRKSDSFSEQDIQCCICIQNFNEIKAQSTVCDHEYCFDCIMEWLNVQNTCPLCKLEINKIKKIQNGKNIQEISIESKKIQIEEEVDEELENADSFCYKCRNEDNSNVLLVCDHCVRKCCHTYCLDPPLEFIPLDNWYCDYCVIQQGIQTNQPIANIFNRQNIIRRRNRQQPSQDIYQAAIQDSMRLRGYNNPRSSNQRARRIYSDALRTTNSKRKLEQEIESYIQQNQQEVQTSNQQIFDEEITEFLKSLDKKI